MKKTILFFVLFFIFLCSVYSQTQVSLQLVDNTGAFLNSYTDTEIKFRRSPFGSGDVISGLTVTHPVGNNTGNYIVTGFTAFEETELWISGVRQDWYGRKYAGEPSNKFVDQTGSVTETISGDKTFSGIVTISLSIINEPYIDGGSSWVTDFTDVIGTSLIFRNYADSVYGIKRWFLDGTKLRLNSGYSWYGRTNLTAPFPIDVDYFSWNDELQINSSVLFNHDSSWISKLSFIKDTTWLVLGEPVSKYRLMTIKKPFWANPFTNIPDFKYYYESKDESGIVLARDSFSVLNNVFEVDNANTISLGTSNTKIDSLYLEAGYYLISFGINYHFSDASYGSAPIIQPDTIAIELNKGSGVGNIIKNNIFTTMQYMKDVNYGRMGTLCWSATIRLTSASYVYLVGKRYNTETALSHNSNRGYIIANLIW